MLKFILGTVVGFLAAMGVAQRNGLNAVPVKHSTTINKLFRSWK